MRAKLWRYFTATKHQKYLEILPDIMHSYNTTKHSAIGMKPADVNEYNAETVWRKVYKYTAPKEKYKSPKFKEGDHVRISKAKDTFEKGYKTNWIKEVFVIKKVLRKVHPEYIVQDLAGEDILGKFLDIELQLVPKGEFEVRKIVRRKGTGKVAEVLVQWKGYPETLKTWIPLKDLKQYQTNGSGLE